MIIEVSETPGLNVVGFETFEQEDNLYVSPCRISSGGGGTRQFEIDVSKFRMGGDWPGHVYWLVEEYAYPIFNPGFWSAEKKSPWLRKKMEIARE